MLNRENVSTVECEILKIVGINDTTENMLDKISYDLSSNNRVAKLLSDHVKDHRVLVLEVLGEVKEHISCIECGSTKLSGFCGILKCHYCKHEMFISCTETLDLCNECVAYDLKECWVHKK